MPAWMRRTTLAGSISVLAAATAVAALPENATMALAFFALAVVLAAGVAAVLLPRRLARGTQLEDEEEALGSPLERLEQLPVGLTGRRYMNWKIEPKSRAGNADIIEPPDPEAAAEMIRGLLRRRPVLARSLSDHIDG